MCEEKKQIMSKELWEKLMAFKRAANELSEQWEQESSGDGLADRYPFDANFEDVAGEINLWVQETMYEVLRIAALDERLHPLFLYKGIAVSDPFTSECGREVVEPIDYYGLQLIETAVKEITLKAHPLYRLFRK